MYVMQGEPGASRITEVEALELQRQLFRVPHDGRAKQPSSPKPRQPSSSVYSSGEVDRESELAAVGVADGDPIFRSHRLSRSCPVSRALHGEPRKGVLDVVGWSWLERQWVEDPELVKYLLFDRAEHTVSIDRATAERIAREVLGTALPSEEELRRLVDAQRARQRDWGG